MEKFNRQIIKLGILLFILFLSNSCIFNKEIKQDTRLNAFRSEIHVILDSLSNPVDRIEAFDSLVININNDKDIVSDRKRNILLMEVYNVIGNEYYSIDSLNKAIEVLTKPVEMDASNAHAYYNRGCAYQAGGQYESALADYDQAIALKPDYTNAIYNRALVYESLENYKQALSGYKSVISQNPSYKIDVYYKLGTVYQDMGMYNEALNAYNDAIKLDSLNVEGYLLKGDVYIEKEMYDSAIFEYNKALKFSPDNMHIIFRRGKIYELKGDLTNAKKDYEYVLETDSDELFILKQSGKKDIKELSHVKKGSKFGARK